jgi:cation-transporting ATPase 13A1
MAPLVDNSQIKSSELLSPLPFYFHTYVWPFAIIWPVFLRYYLSAELYDKYIQAQEWTVVWCGIIITLQSLVWLSTNWSVDLKAIFTATKAKSITDAQFIKVIPIANAGSAEICRLIRDKVDRGPNNPLRRNCTNLGM